MKLSKLLKNVNTINCNVELDTEIKNIVFDSRKVETGSMFVAMRGTEFDGHNYVEAALQNGAACCITERYMGKGTVTVENSRAALAIIAANFYDNPADSLKFIGVTGTNGKTTSTYLIKQVLEDLGYKVGLIGTINNMIGDKILETNYTTPEPTELHKCFSMMKAEGVDYVIMEVSSQALDQHRVDGIHFENAVFTNLTQDHLDYHKTMESYLEAKLKLFEMCDTAILNYDEDASEVIASRTDARKLYYSRDSYKASIFARNIMYRNTGVEFEVFAGGKIAKIRVGIPGKFTVYNILGVVALCEAMGIDLDCTARSLAKVKGVKGRAEIVPTDKDFTIVIDYAHSPDALMNIILAIREGAPGRVVTVFGCGGDRDKTKRPIMGKIATDMSDFAIITSDNPRTEDPREIINDIMTGVKISKTRYAIIENRREAIEYAISHAAKNDTIILAGKGHETYQILKEGKIHFDEREIIKEALEK